VVSLSQQGVGDDVLVNYIRSTHSRFDLTPGDIAHLHGSKVSDRVITEMMNTRNAAPAVVRRQPRTVVIEEPPTTVIYERPWGHPRYWGPPPGYYCPPPPPPIGLGFSYIKVR
ncbi:MAG: hypothetical protein ACRC7O_08515, partial [Fimbriiglobus sp.]